MRHEPENLPVPACRWPPAPLGTGLLSGWILSAAVFFAGRIPLLMLVQGRNRSALRVRPFVELRRAALPNTTTREEFFS